MDAATFEVGAWSAIQCNSVQLQELGVPWAPFCFGPPVCLEWMSNVVGDGVVSSASSRGMWLRSDSPECFPSRRSMAPFFARMSNKVFIKARLHSQHLLC